jgi:hypothetical protein
LLNGRFVPIAMEDQRDTKPGRYRAPDSLLAFLDAL